jgi:N-formylglutamate amidohydrolase
MHNKLPIAIISPHGGLSIPPELVDRVDLSPEQIFNEADAYIDDLFDFRDRVLYFETFPFARTIIDVNRPADASQHHRVGDGVVKTITGYGDAVYRPGMEPNPAFEQVLIGRYWQPWQNRLHRIAQDQRVKLVLDCHSMAAIGPTTYDDPAQMRPRIEVANLGDVNGNVYPQRKRVSASAEMACFLAGELGRNMADVHTLAPTGANFAINTPFWGGWDIQTHSHADQPWLMIELNRALYIGPQSANSPIIPLDQARLSQLRERLWQTIEATMAFVSETL